MRLWIDNTGLHAAGQCLSRLADFDYDVRGLFQLATFIVYADSIELNGFECDAVASRSIEIRDDLASLGLEPSALSIKAITEDAYALACETTADFVGSELIHRFQPDEFRIVGGDPPHLPSDVEQRLTGFIKLASEPEGSEALLEARATALDAKAPGAVEYMLSVSPELRSAVAKLMRKHKNWTENHSYQLNIFLRYYLNDALAEQSFGIYGPAVARAEAIDKRCWFVQAQLEELVDSVVEEFRQKPLPVPSLTVALLDRSRGDPRGVLEEAIKLRRKAKQLRAWLGKHVDHLRGDSSEGKYEIRKKIQQLGAPLRKYLNLQRAPRLADALDVKFVVGLPAPTLSGKKLLKWLRYRMAGRRTAVLADIVKASAYSDFAHDNFPKLVRNSCRRG